MVQAPHPVQRVPPEVHLRAVHGSWCAGQQCSRARRRACSRSRTTATAVAAGTAGGPLCTAPSRRRSGRRARGRGARCAHPPVMAWARLQAAPARKNAQAPIRATCACCLARGCSRGRGMHRCQSKPPPTHAPCARWGASATAKAHGSITAPRVHAPHRSPKPPGRHHTIISAPGRHPEHRQRIHSAPDALVRRVTRAGQYLQSRAVNGTHAGGSFKSRAHIAHASPSSDSCMAYQRHHDTPRTHEAPAAGVECTGSTWLLTAAGRRRLPEPPRQRQPWGRRRSWSWWWQPHWHWQRWRW